MNEISELGHAALWKKYAMNHIPSAVVPNIEPPQSSPSQTIDTDQVPCAQSQSCASSPEQRMSPADEDSAKSIDMEPLEERPEIISTPSMSLEECLTEKANIDHVLGERAKLGPFLIESTERPVVKNLTDFQESVIAIRSKIHGPTTNYMYDNVQKIQEEYRAYGLNRIDVIAIRLYTTAVGYVVNEALRNYSLHHMPISPAFLPYIYALLNGLAKIYPYREIDEGYEHEHSFGEVARYIPVLDKLQSAAIQPIIDAHQPGAYVMYPGFTSGSNDDRAAGMWLREGFSYRFMIKSRTATRIGEFSIHPSEYECVFLPGTVFHILERDGTLFVMEEVVPHKLKARREALPC